MKYFFFYKSQGVNLFNFPILSALVAWSINDNIKSARSICVKLDFVRGCIPFRNHKSDTWLCNTLKWKYHTYTLIIFSSFIPYSSLVKQYSFKGDFEFFCPHVRLLGDSKMRNTGCPKKFAGIRGTVYCCFVIKFFPRCLTRLVINGARIFLIKSIIN